MFPRHDGGHLEATKEPDKATAKASAPFAKPANSAACLPQARQPHVHGNALIEVLCDNPRARLRPSPRKANKDRPPAQLSGYVTHEGAHWQATAGGGFISNLLAVNVSYQTYYMPLYTGRAPFQNSMVVSLAIHGPHDIALNLSSYLLPTGKIRFTTYGDTWTHEPFAAGGAGHAEAGPGGKYAIRGVVVDQSGAPVEGAAIRIGKDECFSDSSGLFFVRLKKRAPQPVVVVPDDFAAAGRWHVVSAPTKASPADEIQIVVAR